MVISVYKFLIGILFVSHTLLLVHSVFKFKIFFYLCILTDKESLNGILLPIIFGF